ncbi:glycosyltransferase family 2 protein [Paenibacillus lemnae]|uniref:Glycosyltransferase n=1 Tax=Paenibacillus lemnae TaxID=1330551 RepID=A0A848M8N9_PAELE|nr:glycosyltransferase [Paenibacillus lemnae]NMO95874.1 glycosyltransferase [Paenibacillus lemnae]
MTPKVTIVIPFYNCPYIQQALTSACGQSYPDIEIIVVDDGSSVHTNLLDPFRDRIFYMGKKNGGTATALNHGIMHASGEYVAWLSSDDLFYPNKIERQVTFMLEQGLDVSYTDFSTIDARSRISKVSNGIPMASQSDLARQLVYSNPINGCTVMARKDLFVGVGLFNEKLLYTHDFEMWVKMVMHGARFNYLHEPLTMYRYHAGMGTMKHRRVINREYGRLKKMYRGVLTNIAAQGG